MKMLGHKNGFLTNIFWQYEQKSLHGIAIQVSPQIMLVTDSRPHVLVELHNVQVTLR